MKLSSDVVDQVYILLNSLSTKRYKDCKPTAATDSEYIVINALPMPSGRIQISHFNVNCHVKDLGAGIPNRVRLDSIANSVLMILEQVSIPSFLIDIEKQELFREDSLGEHYMNLRFSIVIHKN